MKTKKLVTGVMFAILLVVGAFSVHAKATDDGSKAPTGSGDVYRKCPPFC